VNIGRIVRMADLTTLRDGLGSADASTIIASGNVLFVFGTGRLRSRCASKRLWPRISATRPRR
jgi:uncharacterized protein (DUF1697 family)